jgi:transcription elongation factor Elf1
MNKIIYTHLADLFACPFCGGKALMVESIVNDKSYLSVQCGGIEDNVFSFGCGIKLSASLKDKSADDVIRRWNKRV